MQNPNKDKKQNAEITPENVNVNEIESLNHSEELDLKTLEEIDAGMALIDTGCCETKGDCSGYCWTN